VRQSKSDRKEFTRYLIDMATRTIPEAIYKGLGFYLSCMILDYYGSPNNYKTLWGISIFVVTLGLLLLSLRKYSLIANNQRIIFLSLLSLVLNSVALIWMIRYRDAGSAEIALPAMALAFAMSSFRLLTIDALVVGGIYCLIFFLMMASQSLAHDLLIRYSVILGLAYAFGAIGANVAETYLYKNFLAEKRLREETEALIIFWRKHFHRKSPTN